MSSQLILVVEESERTRAFLAVIWGRRAGVVDVVNDIRTRRC